MSTDVLMPQMGESVAEGTIVRWIKRVGDAIEKDEPLFEISTDKVDAEIPSPDGGVLLEIRVSEGQTVDVNSVVAVIGQPGELPAPQAAAPSVHPPRAEPDGAPAGMADATHPLGAEDRRLTRSSPLVRKMAAAHGIDITKLSGSGIGGRVTKRDMTAVIDGRGTRRRTAPTVRSRVQQTWSAGEDVRIEPMSVMRKKIAEHMLESVRVSPHVYSTIEVDFDRVDGLRRAHGPRYEADGTKLTFTVFLVHATARALRQHPVINASVDGDKVVYHRAVNIGVAVALESGLIVPVIRGADELSMLDTARAIQDLAERARTKQLKHDEVQSATFTITNPGVFGVTSGLPIINQPQVAILAVGSVDKRVVVVDDMIAVRPMSYITLGHDHRLVDGADAGRFLQTLKAEIQEFDSGEL